jgi:hypothetical protein
MKTILHRLLEACPPEVTHRVFFDHIADLEKDLKAERRRGAACLRNAKALAASNAKKARQFIRKCLATHAELTRERNSFRRQFEEAQRANATMAEGGRKFQMQMQRLQANLNQAGLSHLFPVHPDLAASHGMAHLYEPKPAERTSP